MPIHLLLSISTYTHYKNTINHYLSTYYVVSYYTIKIPFNVERVAKKFAIFEKFSFWESIKKTQLSKNVFFSIKNKRSLKKYPIPKNAKYLFVGNTIQKSSEKSPISR